MYLEKKLRGRSPQTIYLSQIKFRMPTEWSDEEDIWVKVRQSNNGVTEQAGL
jgi:hypothetical protein